MCLWISIPKLFCQFLAAVRWDTPILYCEPACHDVPFGLPYYIVDQGRDKNNTGVPAGLPVFVQHQNLFPRSGAFVPTGCAPPGPGFRIFHFNFTFQPKMSRLYRSLPPPLKSCAEGEGTKQR